MAGVQKKLSERAPACLLHLALQAFVATIMKLKTRTGTIFRNCKNLMMGTSGKGDKSAILNK